MKLISAVALAVCGMAAAQSVNPAQASASFQAALPSSVLAAIVADPADETSIILQQFATGLPAWFTSLPAAVQSYYIAQAASVVPSGSASATGGASASMPAGGMSNLTTTASGLTTAKKTSTGAGSTATATGNAQSSSSAGAGAIPTAVIGSGVAGLLGVIGMMAL